jgi:hypothetical protein
MTGEDQLAALLQQHFDSHVDAEHDAAAGARVLAALARPLPPQRRSRRLWPAELLDWNFAPAWPRLAALAGCAALGFAVAGIASPMLQARHAPLVVAQRDVGLAAALSEPEPLTGVQP